MMYKNVVCTLLALALLSGCRITVIDHRPQKVSRPAPTAPDTARLQFEIKRQPTPRQPVIDIVLRKGGELMKDTPVEIGLYLNGNLNDRRHLRTRSNGLGVVTIDFNGLWHKIPQEVEFVQVIIIAGLRSVFVKVPINKVVVKLIELPAGSYATLLSTDVDGMQGRALSFRTGWKARLVSSRGSRDGLLHICKDSFVGWIDSPFRVSEKPITYYAIDGGQSCQLDIE